MTSPFQQIQQQIEPLRQQLLNHSVYSGINGFKGLHCFMEHHIFCVWDFMSLLKALQQRMSCVEVPWIPVEFQLGARLVNDIVLAEESDEDGRGGYASHYHLYHQAMQKTGANTITIDHFLERLKSGQKLSEALPHPEIPTAVQHFVSETFEIVESNDLCAIASAFTFGREDLLPDVFERIVEQLNAQSEGELDEFIYYLQRHIELDGDVHGPMAERLLNHLCGNDEEKWHRAAQAATKALEARLTLWNGIAESVGKKAICE